MVSFWVRSHTFFVSTTSLAAIDCGADVEQSTDCPAIQNCQVMRSIGSLIVLTLKDNMVNFCSTRHTVTGRRMGRIAHSCRQERKLPIPGRRRLSRTHAVLGRAIPGGGCRQFCNIPNGKVNRNIVKYSFGNV